MIVKFLKSKNGGGVGSLNYVLDKKRVSDGTARVLRGNEQATREIVKGITKKQKTTFAVLSFEESNIDESLKQELMDEFENTFFAGFEKEDFNILWVEHTDKGRLELNAIIPKVLLSTGRAYNPYNHKTDFHLADLLQKKLNAKHGFSDPRDPKKEASITGSKKEIGLFKNYKKLDNTLHDLVANGVIQDRSDLIELLKKNDIKVTRRGKDYISVKLPDSKKAKRLKGGIYEEQFRSIDELGDIRQERAQRERAFANRDREAEYRETRSRLAAALRQRAEYNKERYLKPKRAYQRGDDRDRQRNSQRSREIQEDHESTVERNQRATKEVGEDRKEELYQKINVLEEVERDRIRKDIERRTRARAELQQESRDRATEIERSILGEVAENESKLHKQVGEALRRKRDRSLELAEVAERGNIIQRSFEELAKKLRGARGAFDAQLRAFSGALDGIRAHRKLLDFKKEQEIKEQEARYSRSYDNDNDYGMRM